MTWVPTYTGRKFSLVNPKADDIDIVDIAHALSQICRYGGHTLVHYSVAQHSVELSYVVPTELALAALLDDGPEAFIGDIVAPLKSLIEEETEILNIIEDNIRRAICTKFDIPFTRDQRIADADILIRADEVREFMSPQPEKWTKGDGFQRPMFSLSAYSAKYLFLTRFKELIEQRDGVPQKELAELMRSSRLAQGIDELMKQPLRTMDAAS